MGYSSLTNKTVKENAQVVADAFTDGDMEVINETIFGTEEFEVNDELSSVWEETGVSQNIIWVVEQDLWHMINKKWYGLNDTLSSNK